MSEPYFPEYAFASPEGPARKWFAWKPVRLWTGSWVWCRTVWRQPMVVHEHLTPGGGDVFYAYAEVWE
jgi:hypothetical protein